MQDSTTVAGVGTFSLAPADSSVNTYAGSVGGRIPYKCSGGTVTVNRLDGAKVSGTFTLNLVNATGSKVITGTFEANKPVIVE